MSAADVPALFERLLQQLKPPTTSQPPPSFSYLMPKPESKQPKQPKQPTMGKGHKYQRSSSGAPFGSSHRKRSFASRNTSNSYNPQLELGHFDGRPNTRYGFGPQDPTHALPLLPPPHHHPHHPQRPPHPPPPFWGWNARQSRPAGHYAGSPPLRPFTTTPPAMPYDFLPPQQFYPPVPYAVERGFGGPFRRSADHEYHEYQNRLFLDEYRFPSPHQAYQPPHVEIGIHTPLMNPWRGENPYELEGKPLIQGIQLRGDAPEFVPGGKPAPGEESVSKPKEPCWLVVSSS
ncbi:uncharacterized protein DSM5745_01951 [Aspergillus mulundensis]|uniref:Uncharacterized protein n=1 Tax=Aspergillus mulundensis TaxID=1810919 RepID=A0A3D8SV60_9EURO|nr:hypothetical protein DSM5745_01951 [Aspergillus mulundensis]RDW90176.1 hypothetical protein DSM5745_01951 [Aspergillus mulundensis]